MMPFSARAMKGWQAVLVFLLCFTVYALTASSSVGLEDDGLFILSSYYAGISHPPGYPFYALSGKLMTSLPFETVAFRAHLTSSLFGALAAVALFWCIHQLGRVRLTAWTGALAFAFSQTFWSQSIVAEVYSLNALCFFVVLGLCLKLHCTHEQSPDSNRKLNRICILITAAYGLSLTNHWPLMVLVAPCFAILVLPEWKRFLKLSPILLLVFLISLSPYYWMIVRSWSDPLISFYGPLKELEAIQFFLARQGYSSVDQSEVSTVTDKLLFVGYFSKHLLTEMGIAAFALAVFGLAVQSKLLGMRIAIALLAGFLGSSLLLILMLGFDYNFFYASVFRVYPLVAYGIMAIWVAVGFDYVLGLAAEKRTFDATPRLVGALIALIVLGIVGTQGWQRNDRSDFTYAEDYARTVFRHLPENAIFFPGDDVGFGSTAYLHLVEGTRSDITLYEPKGLVLNNRLFPPLKATIKERAEALYPLVQSDREVYMIGQNSPFTGVEHFGLFNRLSEDINTEPSYIYDAEMFNSLEQLLNAEYRPDEWLTIHRDSLSQNFGYVLGAAPIANEAEFRQRLENHPYLLEDNLHGQVGIALGMAGTANRSFITTFAEVLERTEQQINVDLPRDLRANFYFASAVYFLTRQQTDIAEKFLIESIRIWPHRNNGSFDQLRTVYQATGRADRIDIIEEVRQTGEVSALTDF